MTSDQQEIVENTIINILKSCQGNGLDLFFQRVKIIELIIKFGGIMGAISIPNNNVDYFIEELKKL